MLALPIFPGRPRIVLPQKHSGGVFPAESGYAQKRTSLSAGSSVCVGIPYPPGQAKDCPAGITVRWTVIGRKNLLLLQEASYVGIPYPPG